MRIALEWYDYYNSYNALQYVLEYVIIVVVCSSARGCTSTVLYENTCLLYCTCTIVASVTVTNLA
jgi:hypothetical protein